MYSQIKKDIQDVADKKFPADEIFLKGNKFWTFKKGFNIIYLTNGEWKDGHITFWTEDKWTYEPEIEVEYEIEKKLKEGYKCIGMRM